MIQTRFVISSDEQITNCDLTDYYYNMDFVRNGEIQGSSLVFFKAHCSCIFFMSDIVHWDLETCRKNWKIIFFMAKQKVYELLFSELESSCRTGILGI